jgi:hypothetical protein
MNRRALFLILLVAGGVLSALRTIAYLAHIHALASALITSAGEIRTKADAEREIAAWRKRSGKEFWMESNSPGGDHNYDAQVANLPVARLHIAEPTGVTVGVTMRDGELRSVTVIDSVGWCPRSVGVGPRMVRREDAESFHMSGKGRSYATTVEFPSSLPEEQRKSAFAVDTACLVRPGGCKTAEAILPGISQLE